MRLFFYTTTNEMGIFFIGIFEWPIRNKIDEIQCVSMNVCLNSTCVLPTDLILKEDASTAKSCAHPRIPKPLSKILPIYGNFFMEKTF